MMKNYTDRNDIMERVSTEPFDKVLEFAYKQHSCSKYEVLKEILNKKSRYFTQKMYKCGLTKPYLYWFPEFLKIEYDKAIDRWEDTKKSKYTYDDVVRGVTNKFSWTFYHNYSVEEIAESCSELLVSMSARNASKFLEDALKSIFYDSEIKAIWTKTIEKIVELDAIRAVDFLNQYVGEELLGYDTITGFILRNWKVFLPYRDQFSLYIDTADLLLNIAEEEN